MSVLIAEVMAETGRGPQHALTGYDNFTLAAITAGLAREWEQGVGREPHTMEEHGEDELAHGFVCGKKPKSIRRGLAGGAAWVISPDDLG